MSQKAIYIIPKYHLSEKSNDQPQRGHWALLIQVLLAELIAPFYWYCSHFIQVDKYEMPSCFPLLSFFLNDRHSSLFKDTVPKEINVITLLRCSKSSPSYHYFSENVLPFFVLVSHSWKNHGCCHATVAKWWHRNLEVLTLGKSINDPSEQDCLHTLARKIPVPALRTSGHSL